MTETELKAARHPKRPRRARFVGRPRIALLKRIGEEVGIPYGSLRDCAAKGAFPVLVIGRLHYAEWKNVDNWLESLKTRSVGGDDRDVDRRLDDRGADRRRANVHGQQV